MGLFMLAVLIHGWTPLAEAANIADAYHGAIPLRMRNPHMAVRRSARRGMFGGRRTLHRMIQPSTPNDAPRATGTPKFQYGKASNGNTAPFESSPAIRARELLPFIGGSASDDMLVIDTTDSTFPSTSSSTFLDTMSQPVVQSMSMIDASMSMRNDLSSNDALELLEFSIQYPTKTSMSVPTDSKSLSFDLELTESDMSMRIDDESSNDTNFSYGLSTEVLASMSMQDLSEISMSLQFSDMTLELSMPKSSSLSFNLKLIDTSMSMKVDDTLNFPFKGMSMSMIIQDSSDLVIPLDLDALTLEMSMPTESNSLSFNFQLIESSMSMNIDDSLSFAYGPSFDPLELHAMSMSMHFSSEPIISLEFSDMSLSMKMIDSSPTLDLELSMTLELYELSTLMSMEVGSLMLSTRTNAMSGSDLSQEQKHTLEDIESAEMSLPMNTSPTHNVELSMSMEQYELDFGELSIPTNMLDASFHSNSPTLVVELISMSMVLNELSMPLDLSDMNIPVEIVENSRSSHSPTLIVELMYTDLNELSTELSMSMLMTDSSYPTQSPSTQDSSSVDKETGGNAGEDPPTNHTQISPLPGTVTVEAEARIDLIGMYAVMDEKAIAVFENSCGSYFGEMIAVARPHIYEVQCEVTNQMLLSERRLGTRFTRGARRSLEEESSLLVDLLVSGSADSDTANYLTNASEDELADLVVAISSVHSMGFVVQLKEDANEAGIDDFERLTSINYIDGDVSTTVDKASESDIESGPNDMRAKIIAILSMAVCGVLMLGMLISHRVSKRTRASSKLDHESHLDERLDQLSPKQGSFYQDLSPRNLQEVTPKNEQLTYMYSLDDGLATPSSIASRVAGSPLSAAEGMQHPLAQWGDDDEPVPSNRIRVDIIAPPGKLGIIIDTCSEGPIVHSVKPTSPLEGLIFKGDLVIAVDDEDTREWSAHYLTKLMVSILLC
jgi:hypothetical protein